MKLKDCLVSIWHDPVYSKVIAGIILAVMGLLYSIVRGLINDSETIVIVLKTVFGYKVNIWIVVAIIWIALIIFDIYKKKNQKMFQFVHLSMILQRAHIRTKNGYGFGNGARINIFIT